MLLLLTIIFNILPVIFTSLMMLYTAVWLITAVDQTNSMPNQSISQSW